MRRLFGNSRSDACMFLRLMPKFIVSPSRIDPAHSRYNRKDITGVISALALSELLAACVRILLCSPAPLQSRFVD